MGKDIQFGIRINTDGGRQAAQTFQTLGREADDVKQRLAGIERSSGAVAASLSRMGRAAAGLAAINISFGGLTQAADGWANLNAQLKIAAGSAQAGALAYKDVLAIAGQTGQALEQVGNVYRRFAESADAMGLSMEQVAGISRTVAQAIALSGGSAASSEAALVQFGQALASGTLRGEELNSVLEQAPRLARALADGLHVPIGGLRDLAEQGAITSERIATALTQERARIEAEFGQLPLTIGRAMENLRTAFTDTVGDVERSTGAFRGVAGVLDGLASHFDAAASAGGALAALMLGKMVSAAVAATQAKLAQAAATRAQAAAALQAAQAASAQAASQALLTGNTHALTAAQAGLAAATQAAAAASRSAMVLGALGGPVGLLTTALTLGAAAWMVWGRRTDEATTQAAVNAAEKLDGLITKLQRLNGQLGQTTASQYQTQLATAESALKNLRAETDVANRELDALDAKGQRFSEAGRAKQAHLDALSNREIALQKEVGEARAGAAKVGTDALNQFVQANVVGAAKVAAERQKLQADFDRIMKDAGGFDAANPTHVQALATLKAKLEDLGKSRKKNTEALKLEGEFQKRLNDLLEDDAKARQALIDLQAEGERAASGELARIEEMVRRRKEDNEEIGLTDSALSDLKAQRLLNLAALKDDSAAALAAIDPNAGLVEIYREQAQALRDLAAAGQTGDAAAAAQKAGEVARRSAEEAQREWQRVSEDIARGLTDAIFEGGKDGWQLLKKTIEATVIRAVVLPVVQGSIQSAMQSVGLGPSSSGGGFGNALSSASDAYNLTTGAGATAASLFAANAAGAVGGDAIGTLIAANSGSWGVSAAGVGALESALGYVAAAAPYIAAIVAVASALGAFDGPSYHSGAATYTGLDDTQTLLGHNATVPDTRVWGGFSETDAKGGAAYADPLMTLGASVAGAIESTLARFGQEAQVSVYSAFGADGADASRGALRVFDAAGNLLGANSDQLLRGAKYSADAATGFAAFADDAGKVIRDALVAADLPAWVDNVLQSIGADPGMEALNAALAKIEQLRTAAETLAPALGLTTDQFVAVAQSLGGTDGLAAYVDAYFSDAEKAKLATEALAKKFDALGVALPKSKEGLRALIEAQDKSTAAGLALWQSLVLLAPAFAEVSAAADTAAASADRAVTAAALAHAGTVSALQRRAAERRAAEEEAARQTEQTYAAMASSVKGWLDTMLGYVRGQLTGDLSTLSPEQKLAEAAAQYQEDLAAAPKDAAARDRLTASHQAYVTAALDYYGSTEAYAEIFVRTNKALLALTDRMAALQSAATASASGVSAAASAPASGQATPSAAPPTRYQDVVLPSYIGGQKGRMEIVAAYTQAYKLNFDQQRALFAELIAAQVPEMGAALAAQQAEAMDNRYATWLADQIAGGLEDPNKNTDYGVGLTLEQLQADIPGVWNSLLGQTGINPTAAGVPDSWALGLDGLTATALAAAATVNEFWDIAGDKLAPLAAATDANTNAFFALQGDQALSHTLNGLNREVSERQTGEQLSAEEAKALLARYQPGGVAFWDLAKVLGTTSDGALHLNQQSALTAGLDWDAILGSDNRLAAYLSAVQAANNATYGLDFDATYLSSGYDYGQVLRDRQIQGWTDWRLPVAQKGAPAQSDVGNSTGTLDQIDRLIAATLQTGGDTATLLKTLIARVEALGRRAA